MSPRSAPDSTPDSMYEYFQPAHAPDDDDNAMHVDTPDGPLQRDDGLMDGQGSDVDMEAHGDGPNTGASPDPAGLTTGRTSPMAPTASADIRSQTPIIIEERWAQMLIQCQDHNTSGRPIRASPGLAALAAIETGATLLRCARPLIGDVQVESAGVDVLIPDAQGLSGVCSHLQAAHRAREADPPTDGAPCRR